MRRSSSESRPRLIAFSGAPADEPLEVLEIRDASLTIGRHISNDLVVREIPVSRHHAVIEEDEEGFLLRDLGSRHGTFVNREPIKAHRLQHGDRIGIGDSMFLFQEQNAPEPHAPPSEVDPVRLDESTFLNRSTELDGSNLRPESLLAPERCAARRDQALSLLLRAAAELGAADRVEDLARRLIDLVLELVPAERAALLLAAEGADDAFDPVFTKASEASPDEEIVVSRTVALRVRREGVALCSDDVRREEDLQGAASLEAARVGSLLAVPLRVAQEPILGVLYLDSRRPEHAFAEDDLRLAAALAGMAAPVIVHLRRLEWTDGERRRLQAETFDHGILGESPAVERVLELIARVARTDTTVLLRGESGTGKELAARALHHASERSDRPFVAINCATLSENLLESELFGHEKGAFTGAAARKIGKFEVAHTGTLFLDEVGELPILVQARLLRALQEREIERVGGTRTIPVDVRIVAATHRDLETAIREGGFREDLFYRLSVLSITMPSLRERLGDVPLLAGHFAARHAARLKRPTPSFSREAREMLMRYSWPGNVRELSNAIERALVLCADDLVRPEDLPEALFENAEAELPAGGYHEAVRETKARLILDAVRAADGNITAAAKALDLHPNYLHRLIRNLDLRSEL